MNVNITKIGIIESGSRGIDEYLLIEDKEKNDLDLEALDDWLYNTYAYEGNQIGDWYCHSIYSVYTKYHKDKAIVTLHHKCDV